MSTTSNFNAPDDPTRRDGPGPDSPGQHNAPSEHSGQDDGPGGRSPGEHDGPATPDRTRNPYERRDNYGRQDGPGGRDNNGGSSRGGNDFGDLRVSSGTGSAYVTLELIFYVLTVVGVFIASVVVDQAADGTGFGADKAWLYVTALTIGYMISRGLSKIGTGAHDRITH